MTTTSAITSYDQYIQLLQSKGLDTTYISGGEANFFDYVNALGSNVKSMVSDSFDTDQDYVLQAEIAAAYKSGNFQSMSELQSYCRANGIQVSATYVSTSYITDNKAVGNTKNAHNGSIAVYTFSDGKGGEIKIADANGNGGLETEEIFMNEILSGVASDIAVGSAGANVTDEQMQMPNLQNVETENKGSQMSQQTPENIALNNGKQKITYTEFEEMIKELMDRYMQDCDDMTEEAARVLARDTLSHQYEVGL